MKGIVLVSGRSNPVLASEIASCLKIELLNPRIKTFPNGELFCGIEKSVRGADVFVVQSTCPPVNDNLVELLIVLDALKRASAASMTTVIPHYGYSRQDRKTYSRTPISAKLVADLLTVAGAGRVVTMDLHSGQVQGFFNIPFDNIHSSPVILEYIQKNLSTKNIVCVAPDSGGVEKVRYYAKKLNCDLAMVDKRRTDDNQARAMNLVGDVKGRDVIIIDDMIDTAGTLIEAVRAIKRHGANRIYACATHAVFSDPALERIVNAEELSGVIVTDTIPIGEKVRSVDKIVVLSTAGIFAETIRRTFHNDSLSSLFT